MKKAQIEDAPKGVNPKPPPFAEYAKKRAAQVSWIDKWLLEKPELIPLHLTWACTALLALFAVMAWRDSKETTSHLAEQAKAAKEQLKELQNEQRPWAYVARAKAIGDIYLDPEQSTTADEPDHALKLEITLANAGKSPAASLVVNSKIIFPETRRSYNTIPGIKEGYFQEVCSPTADQVKSADSGSAVFPNQGTTMDIRPLGDYADLVAKLKEGKLVIVVGCISYVPNHHTRFAYYIDAPKPAAGGAIVSKADVKLTADDFIPHMAD